MKILLVEDMQSVVQLLTARLAGYGHDVVQAENGRVAVEKFGIESPDLVLMDIEMPVMNGFEAVSRIRALEAQKQWAWTPIIFLTATDTVQNLVSAIEAGGDDFMSKSAAEPVLNAKVKAMERIASLRHSLAGANLLLGKSLSEVHALNDCLEARVRERTAELQAAVENLRESQDRLASSEAKATLSTLVAGVSHELGTPIGNCVIALTTVTDHACALQQQSQSGTMKRSDMTGFISTLHEINGLMLRNLERAKELLGQFLQVAADQASEQRREFDLAEAVNEIVGTLAPTLRRLPHRVVVDIPPGIHMDSQPGPLGQIIINLVNNACLHAFEGRNDGLLTIQAHSVGDEVSLCIIDNGVGIPAENLTKLFNPFFSTKIGKGGTGLGMAIVNNLVNKTLGGKISVQSVVGRGTQVDIRIPRHLKTSQ